jgi:hypothetical protein
MHLAASVCKVDPEADDELGWASLDVFAYPDFTQGWMLTLAATPRPGNQGDSA